MCITPLRPTLSGLQKEQKELEEFELWEKLAQDTSVLSQPSAGRQLRGSAMVQRVQSQPSLVQLSRCGGTGYNSDGASTGESESDTRDSECVSDGGGDCRARRRKLAKLPREPLYLSHSAEVSSLDAGEADLDDSHLLSDLDGTLVAPDNATPHTGPAFEFDDKETWQSFNAGTPQGKGAGILTGSSVGSSPRLLNSDTHTDSAGEAEVGQGGKPEVARPASRAESLESIHSTSMGTPLYSSTPPVKKAVPCGDAAAINEQRGKGEVVSNHDGDPLHKEGAPASNQHTSGSSALVTSTTSPAARLTLVNQSQVYESAQEPLGARVLRSDPPTASSLMSKLFPGLKKQPAAPPKGKRDSVGTCMYMLHHINRMPCHCVCVCVCVCVRARAHVCVRTRAHVCVLLPWHARLMQLYIL